MKKFLLIFFVIFSDLSFSQSTENLEKYFIYFNDKGIKSSQSLSKDSDEFAQAEKLLSERAIKRRIKNSGDEKYISFEDIPVYQPYVDSLINKNVQIIWKLKWLNAVSCFLNYSQIAELKKFDFIKSIEVVKKFKLPKDDTLIDENKTLKNTSLNSDYGSSFDEMSLSDIPVAHNLGITGDGVLIGVLDAGFKWQSHPALKNINVIDKYDFVYKDTDVSNDNDYDHGSSVLSLIAGNSPGNLIAPAYNASFILAKTEDVRTEKNIEEDNYAAALEWMESKGVDITTASLGYSEFDAGQISYTYSDMDGKTAVTTKALEIAFQKGIITINSAGNEAGNSWHYITAPADGFNVITVGAVDGSNKVASFSSRGPTYDGRIKPEICAYGVNNFVASAGTNSYKYGSGTSYATPIVAGMTAQLLSVFPHLTNRQVRRIIIESGDNSANPNNDVGYGLLSIKRALCYPNFSNSGTTLNKIFIPEDFAFDGNVKVLHKRVNETEFRISDMTFDNLIYHFDFTDYSVGDEIQFYFIYNYNNVNITEPNLGYYNAVFGSDDISYATDVPIDPVIPADFKLYQNFPNPFNPNTTISFSIPRNTEYNSVLQNVSLKVYDILGREVATLVNENKPAGLYNVQFSMNNLHSGVYFYTLKAGSFTETKKMILLK
jgi:hypothetical protein